MEGRRESLSADTLSRGARSLLDARPSASVERRWLEGPCAYRRRHLMPDPSDGMEQTEHDRVADVLRQWMPRAKAAAPSSGHGAPTPWVRHVASAPRRGSRSTPSRPSQGDGAADPPRQPSACPRSGPLPAFRRHSRCASPRVPLVFGIPGGAGLHSAGRWGSRRRALPASGSAPTTVATSSAPHP